MERRGHSNDKEQWIKDDLVEIQKGKGQGYAVRKEREHGKDDDREELKTLKGHDMAKM